MATKIELLSHEDKVLSPITKASNVLFENGKTAQDILNDKQDENFTPKITSSGSMFKVGQGDNADYSSNVANGAYESIVLKGKTMVNCIQEPSSQDVVLPYEFEDGQYVTINDTKESGALGVELKGQTLVNCLTNTYKLLDLPTSKEVTIDGADLTYNSPSYRIRQVTTRFPLKPNVEYLFIVNVKSMENTSYIGAYTYDGTNTVYPHAIRPKTLGWNFMRYTPPTSIVEIAYYVNDNPDERAVISQPMIIEYQEGMENWDIPYFEGMTSCKMPILHTVGKNLFDKNNYIEIGGSRFYSNTVGEENVATEIGDLNHKWVMLKLPIGKTYSVELDKRNTHPSGWTNTVVESDVNTILEGATYRTLAYALNDTTNVTRHTFTTTKPYVFIHVGYGSGYDQNKQELLDSIILNAGSSVPAYEPYKSSILSLPEEVVLRSLPNGVCDTFNTRTGVYTQRIGELVFDGSDDEDWRLLTASSNWVNFSPSVCTFVFPKPSNCALTWGRGDNENSYLTNKFPAVPSTDPHAKEDKEKLMFDSTNIKMAILKTSLKTEDVEGLRIWLSQNPIVTQYELATPIITKINLSSTLKSWNTTTHIYSEIPENTLYPTLTHSNPSYPVILKPSTKYSIVADSYSNDHTNSAINFNLGGATASATVGSRVTTITTPSTLSNELLTMSGRGNKLNNVMVIEGDVVGDEPYFEGICDCKSPILSNVGKNLIPSSEEIVFPFGTNMGIQQPLFSVKLKPNTTYVLSGYFTQNVGANGYCLFLNSENRIFSSHNDAYANTPPENRLQMNVKFTTNAINVYATITANSGVLTGEAIYSHCQLEESPTKTIYEPYKSNILSFNQNDDKTIVLRSLPSGVCDTLNVETGEYVQRIGERVFNGGDDVAWEQSGYSGNDYYAWFTRSVKDAKNALQPIRCDKLPQHTSISQCSNDMEGCIQNTDSQGWGNIWIKLYNKGATTSDLKSYLSQNPITVQYELATPIVSTIDVQGFPHAYKDGHVQLSSGHSGQSLIPKVEYSLPTNRNGQIRSNQKMVEKHQKELDQLQAIILANLVNSQYNQTLTTLNYELSRV